jgi:membrane-bound ClpP family serine protease
VAMGFRRNTPVGIAILLVALAGTPTVIVLAFKVLPKTPMGRRLLLTAPTSEEVLPDTSEKQRLKALIGHIGRAKSKMLLSGAITVDGRTIEAISESLPIEVGQPVKIVQVRGHRVVVRPLDEEPAPSVDPLQRTYDEPFDLPPA